MLAEPLRNERVRLRDGAERDIPEVLIAFEEDPDLHLRLVQDRPPSGAELGRLSESEVVDRAAGSRATLTITAPEDDLCLGQLSVHGLDWDNGRGSLSVWVAPAARRRGLASGALALASEWLLGRCGLERVQMLCEPENRAAAGAAARAGFSAEGVLHGYLRRRGTRVDALVLARVGDGAAPEGAGGDARERAGDA
jgi:RimJ/RimL family protein N-acetyltransferase